MTAIAKAFVSAFQPAEEIDPTLKLLALLCGTGVVVSLIMASWGLDVSGGFF
jgi:hypothetical protein